MRLVMLALVLAVLAGFLVSPWFIPLLAVPIAAILVIVWSVGG